MWTFERLDTFRQTLLHRAGRLTRPRGILPLNANSWFRDHFLSLMDSLKVLQHVACVRAIPWAISFQCFRRLTYIVSTLRYRESSELIAAPVSISAGEGNPLDTNTKPACGFVGCCGLRHHAAKEEQSSILFVPPHEKLTWSGRLARIGRPETPGVRRSRRSCWRYCCR